VEAPGDDGEAAAGRPELTEHAATDAELVQRCRAGDDNAWRELVDRFSRYVYAISVQGFRLPQQDAEDVFQEVFARVYERLGSLRDDEAVRPWIAQLTRRLCIDRLRAGSHESDADIEELPEVPAEDELESIEQAFDVHEAMTELPETCRQILDRFFAQDESYRTIGDQLGLPAGTIASRISRCLDKLRDAFEGEGEGRNLPPAPSGGQVT
jgi:RNA polymerase sigma factor (sigma-70 family)